MRIPFTKMNGAGNDFVMIDHRDGALNSSLKDLAPRMCHRHFGVGADGLILIEKSSKADFKMRIINADGSEAEMCGNGARCAVKFAQALGMVGSTMTFETLAGVLHADILDDGRVSIQMSEPFGLNPRIELKDSKGRLWDVGFINTGVPHAMIFVENLDKVDVEGMGRLIRYHEHFAPAGTNVNVVQVIDGNTIRIRTYERGVEGETFACGTGATASAILASLTKDVATPVRALVKGGELAIDFQIDNDNNISQVVMTGSAETVFDGGYDYV